jgi:hypothetical protein
MFPPSRQFLAFRSTWPIRYPTAASSAYGFVLSTRSASYPDIMIIVQRIAKGGTSLVTLEWDNDNIPSLDAVLKIACGETQIRYNVRSSIYYKNDHFTACVVTSAGQVWSHDGMFTVVLWCTYDSDVLTSISTNRASVTIYLRIYPPPRGN